VSRSVVAVGGPPGSGKSTAAQAVARELSLEYRSVGDVFRAQAKAKGLDLAAYGRYAEAHPEVDVELDRAMQALARPGVLLDGRIQGALCRRRGVAVVAVVITAAPAERARRLSGRDGQSVEEAARAIARREASERTRYLKFYGIDVDREPADLRVDSTSKTPEEVTAEVVRFVRRRWEDTPG
jgi:CMP/dCMP kinase